MVPSYTRGMKQKTKALLTDILGFTLIIAAVPIGWLPGPGGIPVLIIGLSLLANNHEWAERILDRVKKEGLNLADKLFDGSAKTKWAVDILSVVFISIAVLLLIYLTRSLKYTVAISLCISATFLFFGNRKRYQAILKKVRPNKHKQ